MFLATIAFSLLSDDVAQVPTVRVKVRGTHRRKQKNSSPIENYTSMPILFGLQVPISIWEKS